MSIEVSTYVWKYSKQKSTALLLMLAIADHAHDDGGGAYPSIAKLAEKARTTPRNIKLLLKQLEAAGELDIQRGAGPKGVNMYRVKNYHPLVPGVKSSVRGGETWRRKGVLPTTPKPSLEPSVEPGDKLDDKLRELRQTYRDEDV